MRGISLRKWEDGTKYIILTSSANSPYSDNIDGDIVYYDGEGQNQDQKETAANIGLMKSNENDRPIYFFKQHQTKGKCEYLGIMEVIDYKYVQKTGFMTYEFKLKKTNLDIPPAISKEKNDIDQLSYKTPRLTDQSNYSNYKRKKRDAAFSRLIKEIYDNQCAVCGKKRFTNSGYPEVEAAHIYPKSKNGADDLRNGIALCKLHHWAFDNGLLAITDNYEVIVPSWIKNDKNYEDIFRFEAEKIILPTINQLKPHKIYLESHRKMYGLK